MIVYGIPLDYILLTIVVILGFYQKFLMDRVIKKIRGG
jgi:hypothetical protein